jgi:ribokinase
MSNQPDIVVVGSLNSDFLLKGERFPNPGETLKGEVFLSAPGGKGANQAVAAARLGARTALVSCVGRDARGQQLRDAAKAEGVNVDQVHEITGADTGAALIMIDATAEKLILAFAGANAHISLAIVEQAAAWITAAKVLLLQFEAPVESVLMAAKIAHRAGRKVVLDPAPPVAMPDELLPLLTAIRPNAHEAEALTGIRVHDRASAAKAARELQRRGVGIVGTQAGEEGDLLLWHDHEIWLPRLPVKAVDATGAGDAFVAALAVAIAENQRPELAGRFCSAAAALTTTKMGAQPALPFRREVEALMK